MAKYKSSNSSLVRLVTGSLIPLLGSHPDLDPRSWPSVLNEFFFLHGSSQTVLHPPLVVDRSRPWEHPYLLQLLLPQIVQGPALDLLVRGVKVQQELIRHIDVGNDSSCI